MSAQNIRIVGILFGLVMLLLGFKVKRNWMKVLLFILGTFKFLGNLLADDKVYEDLEAQINEHINRSMDQL